jgi:hypothetical protein
MVSSPSSDAWGYWAVHPTPRYLRPEGIAPYPQEHSKNGEKSVRFQGALVTVPAVPEKAGRR